MDAVTQRKKSGNLLDARSQWTNMALLGILGDKRVWDPGYPQELLLRLRCKACRAVIGRVVYHDGTAHGARVPVYLADVQTAVVNRSVKPVEVVDMTAVLSPLAIDLAAMRRVVEDPTRRDLLDETHREQLDRFIDDLSDRYPDGQIPVTAPPDEEIRAACNVVAHHPQAATADQLLRTARAAQGGGVTETIYL